MNTHTPASLYVAFPSTEGKRLVDTLETHDTPKHGSWPNHRHSQPTASLTHPPELVHLRRSSDAFSSGCHVARTATRTCWRSARWNRVWLLVDSAGFDYLPRMGAGFEPVQARRECLDQHWFETIVEARKVIEACRLED